MYTREMTVTIRAATAADAEAIATIHNQGIEDRIATLDIALRSPEDSRAWLAERGPRHPVIVAIAGPGNAVDDVGHVDGAARIVGWGSLNRFNPRAAYDHVVDFSVYVERGWRGRGIGGQLLDRLVELARSLGYHKMVLSALARNAVGIAMYARAGFDRVGIYREQGQLDGEWVDTVIMERIL